MPSRHRLLAQYLGAVPAPSRLFFQGLIVQPLPLMQVESTCFDAASAEGVAVYAWICSGVWP